MSTGPLYSTPPQVWIISPSMTLVIPTVACRPRMATAMSAGAQGVVTTRVEGNGSKALVDNFIPATTRERSDGEISLNDEKV